MKRKREDVFKQLVKNINLHLKEENNNILAVTSDVDSDILNDFISEFAGYFGDRKVLVLSYDNIESNVEQIEFKTVDALCTTDDEIKEIISPYDVVIVSCPNVLKSNCYLHISHYVKDVIIYTKQYKSRLKNIQMIKANLENKEFNVLGIVNQKIF